MSDKPTYEPKNVGCVDAGVLAAAIARVRAGNHPVQESDLRLICDAAAERAAAQPVAWMKSPHGAIHANSAYRWTAPQSVTWSIPLYAAPPAPASEPTRHPCGHLIVSDECVVCAKPASEPQAEPQPSAIPIAPVEVVRQALKELLESISECRMDQVTARFAKASVMARAVVDRYKDAT